MGSAAVAAVLAFAAAPVLAATVPVRAFTHPTYGRIVFDWTQGVEYSAAVEGDKLVVSFDQAIEAPLTQAVRGLRSYVDAARVRADGRSVEFDLKRPVTVSAFRSGTAVAIDLKPAALTEAAPSAGQTASAATNAAAGASEPARPTSAQAATAVKVPLRAADHPTYTRLVFDWPTAADYSLRRDGGSVTLLFDRPGTLDAPRNAATLRNAQRIEGFNQGNGSLAVTFAAPIDAEVKDFKNGRSVVVDVQNAGTRKAPDAPAAAPAAGAEPPAARPPTSPAAPAAGQTPAAAPQKPANPPAQTPQRPAPGPVSAQPVVGQAPSGGAQNGAAQPTAAAIAAPATAAAAQPTPLTLTFDAGGPAAAAVFPRAGHLYVVFDRTMPIGAGKLTGTGADTVGPVEPVPVTGGTAFRTKVGPFIWPKVERQGTTWKISESTRLAAPALNELRVDPDPEFLLGARLLVRASDAANVVQVNDPDVGDRLQVVPLPVVGQAVGEPRRYPDVELIPAFQGVVVRPNSDNITVRPVKEGVEISAAGGLHLSGLSDTGLRPPSAMPPPNLAPTPTPTAGPGPRAPERPQGGPRLFDFANWQRGGLEHYNDNRQALQIAAAEAPDDLRAKAQLDLAKFYLSFGFGQEALGVLDVIQANQPDLEGWPEFRSLRGAARVLSGDLDGAKEDLAHPQLANNPEAELWRAAMAAQRGDWPAAAAGFKAGAGVLATYPEPLLSKMSLLAAEAALRNGDAATAQRLVDRVMARGGTDAEERPDIQYLRGELYRLAGDGDRAIEQFKAAYNGLDRYYRTKAGLALVNTELAEGKVSPAGAAERLWGLTYTWRGDDLEMDVRQRLGEVQIAAGNYAEGFNTMKDTAGLVAETPRAETITREMQRAFTNLFKDGGAKLPTLDALKLYDQFRELTPVGAEGDDLIRSLAERLADIDLLNRAADLYQHQVEYRLSGIDKARAGTRLASIRLLDRKPEDALKALEMSNVPDIPADLAGERRIMQAKALAELGRGNEAVQLLAADDSRPADLLRVDIAWRGQKWDQAATALGKVIGAPPAPGAPLEPASSQLVLNRAVALALAGDGTGLNTLRKDFGGAMASGPDADAFRVLTRPEQATGLIDVNTIRSRVAEVDVFKNFLKGYRSRQTAAPPGGQSAAIE